jgi:hypothetical protein
MNGHNLVAVEACQQRVEVVEEHGVGGLHVRLVQRGDLPPAVLWSIL